MKDRFFIAVRLLKKILLYKQPESMLDECFQSFISGGLKTILKHCRDQVFLSQKISEYNSYDPNRAYRGFVKQVSTSYHRKWWLVAGSVAALMLLFIGLIGIWGNGDTAMDFPVQAEHMVVEPGSKKAVLHLADGSIVNVSGDSMQIEEKSGAKIRYKAGGIAYEATKKMVELVYNELVVPVAGECYIVLDDGTKVWMNAGSKLKYPLKFVGTARRVYLEGEAYFDVKKGEKPFIVSTSLGEVNVMGTSFDVKAYPEEKKVYTTLVTGRVCFQGKEKIEISPGEQAVATVDGKLEKRQVDTDEYTGWKNGLYVFKKQTLRQIMTDLGRWYGIAVFYQQPELQEICFTGNLKRYDDINIFMEALKRTGDVKYKINGKTLILFK